MDEDAWDTYDEQPQVYIPDKVLKNIKKWLVVDLQPLQSLQSVEFELAQKRWLSRNTIWGRKDRSLATLRLMMR